MSTMKIGMCFPRELPAALITTFAERLDAAGVDELWVIEDCFYTAGPSLAAAALARTEHLTVGIGILPAVARTAAMTAMELATLAALGPGRLIAGIGHGVQEWMAQMGVRPASPLTALEEVISAVRRLLAGEALDVQGDYVTLRNVTLDQPPDPVPPVLAGVRGPRSLAVAGAVADGLVLAELSGPTAVREAIAAAAPTRPFQVAVYSPVHIDRDRRTARAAVAPLVCQLVGDPPAGLRAAPFFDELAALVRRDGASGVVGMPDDWWTELAAVGTPDDVAAHIAALATAGATSIALFPPPTVDGAREQRDRVLSMIIR